jgi:hypothetical protein
MLHDELVKDEAVAARVAAAQEANPGKRVRAIDSAAGVLVCVQPTRQQLLYYETMIWGDDVTVKAGAHEELLKMCVFDPDKAAMRTILEDWPGVSRDGDVLRELRILYGGAKDSAAKK